MRLKTYFSAIRAVTPAWWLALIGPILLVEFPALPFANGASCDPWYLFGLYNDLPFYVSHVPGTRQVGRLALNLPGYLLTQFFSGVVSDYALFLLIFTVSVLFLFRAAELIYSRREACFIAILFGLNPLVVANYSWTLFTPALMYEIIALFCAVRATVISDYWKRMGWLILSGMAFGAAINAHLATLIYSVFIYALFAFAILLEMALPIWVRLRIVAMGAFCVLVGVSVFTAAIGLIGVISFHAHFSMVLNQVLFAPIAMINEEIFFWKSGWYSHGPKLGSYLLGLLLSFIATASFFRAARGGALNQNQIRRVAVALSFLLAFACLLANDFLLRGVFLQYEYYYVFLWPFLLLAVFSAELTWWDWAGREFIVFLFVVALVCLSANNPLPEWENTLVSVFLAIASGVLALASMGVRSKRGRMLTAGAFAVSIALIGFVSRPDQVGVQLWWSRDQGIALRRQFERVHLGLSFISRILTEQGAHFNFPKFWTDVRDTPDGIAYARSYFGCSLQIFPKFDPKSASSFTDYSSGDTVVVVARGPSLRQRMIDAFERINLVPKIMATTTMADPKGTYEIVVTTVTAKAASATAEH